MNENFSQLQAANMTTELNAKRAELRKHPDDRVLELDIEALEQRRDVTQREGDYRAKLVADRKAATAQREQDARAELEAKLKQTYMQASPGTTEAEATAALPDLLHRHRLAQIDAQADALAQARSRLGRL